MRVEESLTIPAPRARVWELVADPAAYPAVLDGFTAFEPEDPARPPGVGARYRVRVRAGSAEVGGLVELTEYHERGDVVWTGVRGIEQRGRLRLRDAPEGGTRVLLRVAYGAPGALLGTLSELVAAPQVRGEVRASLASLAREATGQERPPPARPGAAPAAGPRGDERRAAGPRRAGRADAPRQGGAPGPGRRALGRLAGDRHRRGRHPPPGPDPARPTTRAR